MYRIIFLLLMISLFMCQSVLAAVQTIQNIPDAAPAVQLPFVDASATPLRATKFTQPELTGIRYAVHTDAVTGDVKLRLVVDVTGPVEVDSNLSDVPTPQLVVDIQGADPGKTEGGRNLDGQIAEQVKVLAVKGGSKLVIDLPNLIDQTDYRVFTLPRDVKANRPFRVVVDINKPAPPVVYNFTAGLKDKVIALDPGHGGSDPGAIGPTGIQEKNVTLAVAQKLQALLTKAGAKVIMTRQTDRDVFGPNASAVDELKSRTTIAAANKADLFVSIHANSFTNSTVGGTATYFYRKSLYDVMLAQNIQDNITKQGGLDDRNINAANFYVIKRSSMPAVLVELAFISNPAEEKLLNSFPFQQRMAQGIYQGLDNFFTQAARQGGGR